MQILLLTFATGLFIFFFTIMISVMVTGERNRFHSRMTLLLGAQEKQQPNRPKKQIKRSKLTVSKAFAEQLLSAGIRMRPEEFLGFWLTAAIVPGTLLILAGANPITLLAIVTLGVVIPPVLVIRAKKKRIIQFEKQLGNSVILMGNCLRSGLTFLQAMSNIATEMTDPIAREFSRTVKEIQLGNNMDEAFNNMVKRMPSTDLKLLVSAVQIQRQSGGNLFDVLENISMTIKDRLQLKDDIRVMTSSGRTSSLIIGLLPVVIAVMLMIINPNYIQDFFKTNMGIGMLVAAGVMEVIGFIVIQKMVTIKF